MVYYVHGISAYVSASLLQFESLNKTPLSQWSQCPGGTFSLREDENSYRNPDGDRKSIIFSSKNQMEMDFWVEFFNLISNMISNTISNMDDFQVGSGLCP